VTCLCQALWPHNSSSCLASRPKPKAAWCTTPTRWCWSQFCCAGCPCMPPTCLTHQHLMQLMCCFPSASRSDLFSELNTDKATAAETLLLKLLLKASMVASCMSVSFLSMPEHYCLLHLFSFAVLISNFCTAVVPTNVIDRQNFRSQPFSYFFRIRLDQVS